jgi:hypothetical protein
MRLLLVALACRLGAASNAFAADIKSISQLAAGMASRRWRKAFNAAARPEFPNARR